MNLYETLLPAKTPDLSKARKVNFSKPDEVKEDKRADKYLRREANAIADQNRRTLREQEKAWKNYELKKAQANRAIYLAKLKLEQAEDRLKCLKKPAEPGLTKEDELRINRFLTNKGAHAKTLARIPVFLELDSLYVEPQKKVSS